MKKLKVAIELTQRIQIGAIFLAIYYTNHIQRRNTMKQRCIITQSLSAQTISVLEDNTPIITANSDEESNLSQDITMAVNFLRGGCPSVIILNPFLYDSLSRKEEIREDMLNFIKSFLLEVEEDALVEIKGEATFEITKQ